MQTDLVKTLLVLIFSIHVGNLEAQQLKPDFIVYYVQGSVKKINTQSPFVLKKGDQLHNTDVVNITASSQVVLICKNYNAIKLNISGTIRLNKLESQCKTKKASFAASYYHFIWDELTDKQADQQTYLHNIGAVSRGATYKMPIWPDTINYLSGDLKIKWNPAEERLILQAFDSPLHDKLLVRINIISNNFNLDSLATRLKLPGVYYWSVSKYPSKNKAGYYLKIWEYQDYKQATDSLLKSVIHTYKAETAYMSGFIMEKNFFLNEALKYYAIAYKLEPKNKIYKTAYSRFL